jgi:hypothetical protein
VIASSAIWPLPPSRDCRRDAQREGGLSETRIAVEGDEFSQWDTSRPKPRDFLGCDGIQPD